MTKPQVELRSLVTPDRRAVGFKQKKVTSGPIDTEYLLRIAAAIDHLEYQLWLERSRTAYLERQLRDLTNR
jgi:hypothetical protein